MIPMDIPINAALNVGTPVSAPSQPAAAAAAPSTSKLSGRAGAGAGKGSSFHHELQKVHDQMRAAEAEMEPHPASHPGKPRCEDSGPPQPEAAKITETQPQPADDPQQCPETSSEPADLLSFLLQVLQGISSDLQPVDPAAGSTPDATGAEVPDDDTAKRLSQLLDILKQLQASAQDVVQSGPAGVRLSELCDQLKEVKEAAAAAPSAELAEQIRQVLPEQILQVLPDLREHLSGMAWRRMIKEIPADQPAPDPGSEKEASPTAAVAEARADAPAAVQNLPEGSRPAIVRKPPADAGPLARDLKPMATEGREAATPEAAPEAAESRGVEREPLVRVPTAPATPATHAGEGGRGSEPARPAAAAADPSGPLGGVREDQQAPTEGDRQPAGDRLIAKTFAGADDAKPEKNDPAVPFEMDTAGQRPLQLHPAGSERAPDVVAAGKEKESAGAGRAGVFDQIVQRAIVQVKTGQSEIKIDLKPEFLGNVRMQIVSENQQVSVRILTELPAVRDMIETGFQQLRSELQNQGLHVDRLEVAVSDDPGQSPRRQARPDELPRPGGIGAVAGPEGPVASGRSESVYYQRRPGSTATIDMFV